MTGHDEARSSESPVATCPDPEDGRLGDVRSTKYFASKLYVSLYPTDAAEMQGALRVGMDVSRFQATEHAALSSSWGAVVLACRSQRRLEAMGRRALRQAECLAQRRRPASKSVGAMWAYWLNRRMEAELGRAEWMKIKKQVGLSHQTRWGKLKKHLRLGRSV